MTGSGDGRGSRWKGSGELASPPVRIVMESQEILEEMVRSPTGTFQPPKQGTLSPLSMSPRTMSRRGSWITPIASSSKASVSSSRHDLSEAVFSNETRRRLIKDFANLVTKGRTSYLQQQQARKNVKKDGPQQSMLPENIIEAAFAAGRWSIGRFHQVIKEIREPAYACHPPEPLRSNLESLHWALMASTAADEGREDERADGEIWRRYSIGIEGKTGPPPQPTDADSVMELLAMRDASLEYFRREALQEIRRLNSDELENLVHYITQYGSAPKLMDVICPFVFKRIPEDIIIRDIMPKFMVLSVLQPDCIGSLMLEVIFRQWKTFVRAEAANSALEYCSHLQRSNCCRVILDNVAEFITAEGVATALIPTSARGIDHMLAVLELFIMDKCQQSAEKRFSEVGRGDREKEDPAGQQQQHPPENEFADLLPPCVYMFLTLAAAAGYAKPGTVKELLEFYEDPCAPLLVGRVTEVEHHAFVKDLFHVVCQLNFTAVIWTLIEGHWVPADITRALYQAIELGHQSLVHILLDSLLIPDEKLEPPSGKLPIVFRKSEALALLPAVAQRFPQEASWFLKELSSIPIPACVPRGESQEAEVRARSVHGTKLGMATLAEITQRTPIADLSSTMWGRIKSGAQLRGAVIGTNVPEAECVICMAPEALLTDEAFHDTPAGHFFRQTSPFIRLLETGEDTIILQPIMQALLEYHWARGGFWYRATGHFLLSLSFITSIWTMFVFIVERANGNWEHHAGIVPVTCVVLFLTALFLIQELREFLDDPHGYMHSGSNLLDMMVYISVLYCAIGGALFGHSAPPLLMGFTLVIACCRLLMQLRIIPSIGPVLRIGIAASGHILPVLVPFVVLACSFAGGFHLIQYPLLLSGEQNTQAHFRTIPVAIQSVLTMTAGDYSVLDYSQHPEVFALRLLFHIIFIIFLVNLIIGLMTVNVANVTVNSKSAWLVEVAQLMVELELYWPWPIPYKRNLRTHKRRGTTTSIIKGTRVCGWSRCFKKWWPWGEKKRGPKVFPQDVGLGRIKASSSVDSDAESGGRPSVIVDTTEYYNCLQRRVVLYTCPEEQVAQTFWWKEGQQSGNMNLIKHESGLVSPLMSTISRPQERPSTTGPWNKAMKLFHIGGSRDMHVPSLPSLVGRSQSSLPPVPDDTTPPPLTPGVPDIRFGLDMRLLDQVEEQEEAMTTSASRSSFVDVRNRRQSMKHPEGGGTLTNKPSFGDTQSPPAMESSTTLKDLSDQVTSLRDIVKTLERITRAETRNQRERTRRLEATIEAERMQNGEQRANLTREVQGLVHEVRQLAALVTPQPQPEGLLRRVFSMRGSKDKKKNTTWGEQDDGEP